MSQETAPAPGAAAQPAHRPQAPDSSRTDGSGEGVGGRPRRRRPPTRWVVAAAAGMAVALGYVGWASPLTLVEHVVVEAPKGISPEAIRLASGISAADHVPAVDSGRVRAAIRAQFAQVAEVTVTHSLPHTIRLTVTARTPLAVLQSGGTTYLMDAGGVLYDKVSSTKGLPVIRSNTEVGRTEARQVLLLLPEDLRRRVTTVAAATHDDVTLTLRSGATVRWGNSQDPTLKARVLTALLSVKAGHYDVSTPTMPTTRGGPTGQGTSGQ